MTAPLGIGLVGLGRHGLRYAHHLAAGDVPGARLAAVCRRTRDAGADEARALGCAFHDSAEALADDPSVEAVIVVTPPSSHVAGATIALGRGLPCLIEKPLGRTLAEVAPLLALAGRAPVAVGLPLRWNAVVREVRTRIAEIAPLRGCWLALRQEAPADGWRGDPALAGGGVTLDFGSHLFDLARWLTGGEFDTVQAVIPRRPDEACETHAAVLATLTTPDGPLPVQCEALAGTDGRTGRIEVVGARGQLVGDFRVGELAKVLGKARVALDVPRCPPPLVGLLAAFVATVRGEPDPDLPGLEDGCAGLAVAEACTRAAATGARVAVAREGVRC